MPDDIKAPYVAKAEAAKAQYDKDMAAYGELYSLTNSDPCLPRLGVNDPDALAAATKW